MTKINKYLDKNILKIITIFLLLTPILDLITSLSINVFKLSFNFMTIIKIMFMFVLLYYVTFALKNNKSKVKKYSIYYFAGVLFYFVLFFINIILNKPSNLYLFEIQNILRTFYFPINLVCLYNIYLNKKLEIDFKKMSLILFTYIALILIPLITNTGFDSYAYSKEGTIGWFNSTNEIGGIISIILPIYLYYIFKNKKLILSLLITLVTFFVLFSMGTKVPILSAMIIIFLWFIRYFVKLIKKRETKKIYTLLIVFILCIGSLLIVLPKTSFYKNIEIHLSYLKVDEISDLVDTRIINKFIFSDRVYYYASTKENYIKSNTFEKLTGIGYSEFYFDEQQKIKMIEMDYFDVFFRHGIIGTLIFFAPYVLILYCIYKKTKKLTKVDNELYTLYISLLLILTLALMSGHIIVAPSVSLIVIFVLLLLSKKLELIK